MTLNEFKYWLEGFEASLKGYAPDLDQWRQIQAKVEQIEAPLTVRVPPGMKIEPSRVPFLPYKGNDRIPAWPSDRLVWYTDRPGTVAVVGGDNADELARQVSA